MLADELGGEENAKANEFLSIVASKMEADKYIEELIAKIDGDDVLAEAEKIVAEWDFKKKVLKGDRHWRSRCLSQAQEMKRAVKRQTLSDLSPP